MKTLVKTFNQWHAENSKYMEPQDIVAWCAEAWMAGYDMGIAIQKELQAKQQENNE